MSEQLSPGAQTIVDERTKESPFRTDEGDHERFSHYVPKDKLTEAMIMGTPVVALAILVAVKIVIDVALHLREHARAQATS